MKFTEPKEKIFSDSSEGPLQNPCRKFNRCYGSNADNKKAIIFIKLLKSGCPRTQSMRFSSKNVCKVDSTKVIDGPTNHRILKIKPGKHYTDDKVSIYIKDV